LQEKIDRLRQSSLSLEAGRTARDAEAEGQYEKAADLYEKADDDGNRDFFILKKAHCLVRAERYEEAVPIFRELALPGSGAIYDYGFALAKTGRFYECLKIWEGIKTRNNGFLAQIQEVRSLLLEGLYERFERDKDYESIYKEGQYLLKSANFNNNNLHNLVEYCRYAWIEVLWKQERYKTIAGLLPDSPSEMDTSLLALWAKNTFKLMETAGGLQADLSMFWLTALYGEVFEGFSCAAEEKNKVRQALVRMAEDLIRDARNGTEMSGTDPSALWDTEKKRIKALHGLIGDRDDFLPFVCTPQFAARFGTSSLALRFIRENRKAFPGREQYLRLGSYYSLAGKSLLLADSGEFDKAIACLPGMDDADEFTEYGVMRVNFACGMYGLENGGDHKTDQHFNAAAKLFDMSEEYEKKLTERTLKADGLSELNICFKILSKIHEKRQPRSIKNALSLVTSRRAIAMFNEENMTEKALSITLKEALDLNSENEHALGNLKETQIALELVDLEKALARHKMTRACRIASKSEYQEVRGGFFDFFETALENIDQLGMTPGEKTLTLKDILKWCIRVDNTHPILENIEGMLDESEQGYDNGPIQSIRC